MATVTSSPISALPTPSATGDPASRVATGLTSAEAQRRLTEFGGSEIRRERSDQRAL